MKNALVTGLLALSIGTGVTGCTEIVGDKYVTLDNGEELRLVYGHGGINWGDRMGVYNPAGDLKEEFHDSNGMGGIGDSAWDKYVIHLTEDKKRTFKKNSYTDENGLTISGENSFSKPVIEMVREKLKDASVRYEMLRAKLIEQIGKEIN